uniref:Telomeric repeat-binding factor 2-interacting protein 1 n=1 Tax=Timema genevievae TaxID=629358 RepID=A0A7R9K706_TIMGE|nr:unnamed protein product [Timema genevievae]
MRTDLRWLVLRIDWFSRAKDLRQSGQSRDELNLSGTARTDKAEILLNKRSRFRPTFDVNDVQDKRLNWVTAEASLRKVEGGPQNANTNSAKVPPRTLYTRNEKKAIVKYIVKNNDIDRVKGRALWEEMEEELKIGRTWQSMKEHFIKSIVPNMDSFKIPANDKSSLRVYKGCVSTSQDDKISRPSVEGRTSTTLFNKEPLIMECQALDSPPRRPGGYTLNYLSILAPSLTSSDLESKF